MKFSTLAGIAPLFFPASAIFVNVTYDSKFDNRSLPLNDFACWKEGEGMPPYYGKEFSWKTLYDIAIPVVAIKSITGPESPFCATCWILDYKETVRPVLALEHAKDGFVIGLKGMESLTGGKAKMLGTVTVKATQVDLSNCGLGGPITEEREL